MYGANVRLQTADWQADNIWLSVMYIHPLSTVLSGEHATPPYTPHHPQKRAYTHARLVIAEA